VKELQEATTVATLRGYPLFELAQTVSSCATSDAEIVATVASLINNRKINNGKVRLKGTFAGTSIDVAAAAYPAPPSSTWSPGRIEGSWLVGTALS